MLINGVEGNTLLFLMHFVDSMDSMINYIRYCTTFDSFH